MIKLLQYYADYVIMNTDVTEEACDMKKWIITISILVLVLLIIPIPLHYNDGGTREYKAALYTIYQVHRLHDSADGVSYIEGTIIKILGHEVYNDTEPHITFP